MKIVNVKNGEVTKLSSKKFLTKTRILIISLIVLGIIGGSALGYTFLKDSGNSGLPQTVNDRGYQGNSQTLTTIAPTPKPPVFIANPINGKLIEESEFNLIKNRPVLAVIIQNNPAARPQHGLNEADLVYETLAEGGITRFMGVFWSRDSTDRVMSIRSARKVFVDMLGEYNDPLFMHIGYSDGDVAFSALKAMGRYGVRRLSDSRNTVNNKLSFSRDKACEKIKATEHCAYSTTKELWEIASQKKWTGEATQIPSWKFDKDKSADQAGSLPVTDFLITFTSLSQNLFNVNWKYEATTGKYLRFNPDGKTAFVDNNNLQISADVIIYQPVSSNLNADGKHLVQDVIGKGNAQIYQDGKVFEVTWNKSNYKDKTRYFLKSTGEEFTFKPGKIWVTLPAKTSSVKTLQPTPTPSVTVTTTP